MSIRDVSVYFLSSAKMFYKGRTLVLKLVLDVEFEIKEAKILCPYCGRYVNINDYYSKHYGGRCLESK